jgi:hypothetical protein
MRDLANVAFVSHPHRSTTREFSFDQLGKKQHLGSSVRKLNGQHKQLQEIQAIVRPFGSILHFGPSPFLQH